MRDGVSRACSESPQEFDAYTANATKVLLLPDRALYVTPVDGEAVYQELQASQAFLIPSKYE